MAENIPNIFPPFWRSSFFIFKTSGYFANSYLPLRRSVLKHFSYFLETLYPKSPPGLSLGCQRRNKAHFLLWKKKKHLSYFSYCSSNLNLPGHNCHLEKPLALFLSVKGYLLGHLLTQMQLHQN